MSATDKTATECVTMQKLLRPQPLTDKEWIELIEALRQDLKPHLRSVTLERLGEVQLSRSGLVSLPKYVEGLIPEGDLDYDEMGFWEIEETSRAYEHLLWGITRDGMWVLGSITTTTLRFRAPASPEDIANAGLGSKVRGFLGLPTIWLKMVQMVESVYQARLRLLEDITKLRESTERAYSLLYRARVEWGQVPVF